MTMNMTISSCTMGITLLLLCGYSWVRADEHANSHLRFQGDSAGTPPQGRDDFTSYTNLLQGSGLHLPPPVADEGNGRRLQSCSGDNDCGSFQPFCYLGKCAECRSDSHCSNRPACVNGSCRECSDDVHCSDPTPFCVIFFGDDSGSCESGAIGAPCVRDDDCNGFCIDDICSECSENFHCNDPLFPFCVEDSLSCESGRNGAPCDDDNDCAESCVFSICSDGLIGQGCSSTDPCFPSSDFVACVIEPSRFDGVRFVGVCREGNPADPDDTCAPGDRCYSDDHCRSNEVDGFQFPCVESECRSGATGTRCNADNNCRSGRCNMVTNTCAMGEAGALCLVDDDCISMMCVENADGDFTCTTGAIGDPCQRDKQEEHCQGGRCVARQCDDGNGSLGDRCDDANNCQRSLACNAQTWRCDFQDCQNDRDCTTAEKPHCVQDMCRAGDVGDPCKSDGDCNDSTFACYPGDSQLMYPPSCTNGMTGDRCNSDAQCQNGRCALFSQVCIDGDLGDPCDSITDCNSSICGRGVCTNGTVGVGCDDDGDCEDERCVMLKCRAGTYGDPCDDPDDCDTSFCVAGRCMNGEVGDQCLLDDDCMKMHCAFGVCSAGNLNDPCEDVNDCDVASDATYACGRQEVCINGVTGDRCDTDDQCRNNRCVFKFCNGGDGSTGDRCELNSHCQSNRCARRSTGSICR